MEGTKHVTYLCLQRLSQTQLRHQTPRKSCSSCPGLWKTVFRKSADKGCVPFTWHFDDLETWIAASLKKTWCRCFRCVHKHGFRCHLHHSLRALHFSVPLLFALAFSSSIHPCILWFKHTFFILVDIPMFICSGQPDRADTEAAPDDKWLVCWQSRHRLREAVSLLSQCARPYRYSCPRVFLSHWLVFDDR